MMVRKKTRELKPDIVLKNYWSNNEQFADLFNAVLFEGRQVIKSDELVNEDTEEALVLEHGEYLKSIRESRDNIKVRKKSTAHGVELVLLGKEGQEHIHYAMPMRVMGYDYGTYRKQYQDNAKKYKTRTGLKEDEYLSRMKRTDKLLPVITVVVYYGEKPWDGAVSLHGMLNISEEMKPFVNDYRIRLIEARENDLVFHNGNNVDLFNLLQILLNRNETPDIIRKKAIKYAREHEVDNDVILTVAGAAKCKVDYQELYGKGEIEMCTVFEETWTEGKAEGIIETGLDFGIPKKDILEKLQEKLHITLQDAQKYWEKFGKPIR